MSMPIVREKAVLARPKIAENIFIFRCQYSDVKPLLHKPHLYYVSFTIVSNPEHIRKTTTDFSYSITTAFG